MADIDIRPGSDQLYYVRQTARSLHHGCCARPTCEGAEEARLRFDLQVQAAEQEALDFGGTGGSAPMSGRAHGVHDGHCTVLRGCLMYSVAA